MNDRSLAVIGEAIKVGPLNVFRVEYFAPDARLANGEDVAYVEIRRAARIADPFPYCQTCHVVYCRHTTLLGPYLRSLKYDTAAIEDGVQLSARLRDAAERLERDFERERREYNRRWNMGPRQLGKGM